MKYLILLPLTVEADPADFGDAGRKGFDALADLFNSGQPVTIHLLPLDDSPEARMGQKVLNCCFTASTAAQIG